MDINFHYYTIKVLAISAGFKEDEAQRIASFSQFVDDYRTARPFFIDSVPSYAEHLVRTRFSKSFFFPVTTGFTTVIDMAMLLLPEHQRWIATPFHFIPKKSLSELGLLIADDSDNRCKLRVVPAKLNDGSLISQMLETARENLVTKKEERHICLMRIGMLLHIFADTYAHQRFSGFQGWENNSITTNVTRNTDGLNMTSSYHPELFAHLAPIGHANIGTVADISNVSFKIRQRATQLDTQRTALYERNNTQEFLNASYEIICYLRSCLAKESVNYENNKNDNEWASLSILIEKGLNFDPNGRTIQKNYWSNIFENINFDYSRNKLRITTQPLGIRITDEMRRFAERHNIDSLIHRARSDDYFRYNVIANEIRQKVVGAKKEVPEVYLT